MKPQTKSIDCVTYLTPDEFNTQYYNIKPVIIKGGAKHTVCYNRWSFNYLKEKVGSRIVKVAYTESGNYNYVIKEVKWLHSPFNEMVELFGSEDKSNNSYYLAQTSIKQYFPELLGELDHPKFISGEDVLDTINIWMGGAGCDSGLHYDNSHNFFYQIQGRKEIALFAPEDSDNLYSSKLEKKTHMSEVDFHHVDTARFPLFNKATPFYCLAEPGDVVYMPTGWWHNVLSLDQSISVNYWWHRFDIPSGRGTPLFKVEEIRAFIKNFIDKGLSIDHQDQAGEPLLLKAVRQGYPNFVEALLLMGADPNTISHTYKPGVSALAIAKEKGHQQIENLLVKYGATEFERTY